MTLGLLRAFGVEVGGVGGDPNVGLVMHAHTKKTHDVAHLWRGRGGGGQSLRDGGTW